MIKKIQRKQVEKQGFSPASKSNAVQINVILKEESNRNYCKQLTVLPPNKNYGCLKNIYFQLNKIEKDFSWLLELIKIERTTWYSITRGNENISMEILYNMAELFRQNNSGIYSPKQLMNPRNISLKYFKEVRNNIRYLKERFKITNAEIIEGTGIEKGNLHCLLTNKNRNPRHETLLSLFKFFRYKGVYLETPLDLIYFPGWGETEYSYLTYHRFKKRYDRPVNRKPLKTYSIGNSVVRFPDRPRL